MRKIILIMFLLIGIFSSQVSAIEAGGEYEVVVNGVWGESNFDSSISENLNLDFFLPRIANNEIQYAFRISNPVQDLLADESASYFTIKLYLRRRFDNFNITVGRQPVSWSFGSLLNPVDYTLGSVVMNDETNSKYTDALEAYIPINWNSGLSVVASYPDGFSKDFNEMKLGVRGRMGIQGYDLTLNYVQESENRHYNLDLPERRVGFSFKGDLGDTGIYAALGHYFDDEVDSSNSYLLGLDYSYNLDYYTKISMQLEYLRLDNSNLSSLLGPFILINTEKERLDLLNGSITYPIDDFSSISLMTIVNLDGSNLILIPGYQNTLPGNIDLDISCSFFQGEENKSSSLSVGLSYPF